MEIELRQVIRAAIRWSWLIVLCTVLAGGLAFALTRGQTATYSATTTLMVNPQQVTSQTDSASLQASRSQAETYVKLVESTPVLERVVEQLALPLTQAQLAEKISVTTVMNTQLIEVTVEDRSPEMAARIANTVAVAFQERVEELTTGRLQNNLQQAKSESAALRARQEEIDAELTDLDTEANRNNADVQAQVEALKEERDRARETVADLDSTIRSINQQLAMTTSPIEVAEEARAAQDPDSPKPMLMTALGLFLGFLVGCGLAAVLELSDRKVRPETNIEELTDARLIAVVPMERGKGRTEGPIVSTRPDSPAAEAIRLAKSHLQGFIRTHPHGVLSLMNAGSGPEASDIFASLAVAAAQAGISTMLVDADLRSPRLHTVLGVGNDCGVADFSGRASGDGDTPRAVPINPALSFVSAGTSSTYPAEVIGSAGFSKAIAQLRDQVDLLLINTPPAMASSDAMSAAVIADGVLLVGRYGESRKDDLAALASTVRECGVDLVGVVMTQG